MCIYIYSGKIGDTLINFMQFLCGQIEKYDRERYMSCIRSSLFSILDVNAFSIFRTDRLNQFYMFTS